MNRAALDVYGNTDGILRLDDERISVKSVEKRPSRDLRDAIFKRRTPEPEPAPEILTQPVVVFSYPGRTQVEAAEQFGRHAVQLASQGYRPISQSWGEGRPGIGRVLTLGVFGAMAIRPDGFLTVTYQRAGAEAQHSDGGGIAERLRKLDEARQLELITEGEYAAQRQRILDSA